VTPTMNLLIGVKFHSLVAHVFSFLLMTLNAVCVLGFYCLGSLIAWNFAEILGSSDAGEDFEVFGFV